MPDAPDGYKIPRSSLRNVVGDLGELGVRLGSPSIFDRSGNVVYFDDARYGRLLNDYLLLATGDTAKLVDNPTYFQPYCYFLDQAQHASANSNFQDYSGILDTTSLGFEITLATSGNYDHLKFEIDYQNPNSGFNFEIQFNQKTHVISLDDLAGNTLTFDGIDDISLGSDVFNNFKVVIDTVKAELIRMTINGYTYHDLSFSLFNGYTANYTNFDFLIGGRHTVGTSHIYLQSVILTVGEV